MLNSAFRWKILCVLFAAGASMTFSPSLLTAAHYHYDQKLSKVIFTLKQVGVVVAKGHFDEFSGSFTFDPDQIAASKVDLLIHTASLTSANPIQDKLLKSKNFFWPEHYPEIRFVSREFKNISGNRFEVHGDLTIKERTHPVIFYTELLTPPQKISAGKPLRFKSYTFIRRKDFKLGTGNLMDPIIDLTKETLKISLSVTGNFDKKESGSMTLAPLSN